MQPETQLYVYPLTHTHTISHFVKSDPEDASKHKMQGHPQIQQHAGWFSRPQKFPIYTPCCYLESPVQIMAIISLLNLVLSLENMCYCSEMRIGQILKFDLFNFGSSHSSYFTKLQIGSPPKTLNVVIDTGSDVTWVKCANTSRNFYNVFESSTAVTCAQGSSCTFDMHYKDGSSSSGYYVSDIIHFSTFLPNSSRSQFSSRVVFGCSTMNKISSNVDGIIGLGRAKESLQSQLFGQHISSTAISHCLAREGGGGYLVMGEVVHEGIRYIPLMPSESKYIVSMESISVNGIQVASTYFPGTIIDSGTTLTLFEAVVYDSLVVAVSATVNKSFLPRFAMTCYDVPSRESFPPLSLNFVGGAALLLTPRDYLLASDGLWCLGFLRDEEMTILGDLVLRDKVIIYDQPHERIGMLTRDCSQSVNVSLSYNVTSASVSWRVTGAAQQHWLSWALASVGVMVLLI